LKTTQNAGAKFATHVEGIVYVVHDSLPKLSLQFIQYITSAILEKLILLSLAIFVLVSIFTIVQASVIVDSLCVASVLCLTTNTSLAGLVLKYESIHLG